MVADFVGEYADRRPAGTGCLGEQGDKMGVVKYIALALVEHGHGIRHVVLGNTEIGRKTRRGQDLRREAGRVVHGTDGRRLFAGSPLLRENGQRGQHALLAPCGRVKVAHLYSGAVVFGGGVSPRPLTPTPYSAHPREGGDPY